MTIVIGFGNHRNHGVTVIILFFLVIISFFSELPPVSVFSHRTNRVMVSTGSIDNTNFDILYSRGSGAMRVSDGTTGSVLFRSWKGGSPCMHAGVVD